MSPMPSRSRSVTRVVGWLTYTHDLITRITFTGAMLATVYLTLVLAWEVFARYGLHSPSGWAPDTSAVSFALIVFLAAPMLSWKGGHANMNMVVAALPASGGVWLTRFTFLVATIVCSLSAWFGWQELVRLKVRGVMVISVTPIPKWWLMSAIVYALISMALYFFRHFLSSFFTSYKDHSEQKAT